MATETTCLVSGEFTAKFVKFGIGEKNRVWVHSLEAILFAASNLQTRKFGEET